MLSVFKKIFGIGPKADIAGLIANGAQIIDVRSGGEYAGGHIEGSVNIPLDQLYSHLDKLKNLNRPIITCCASGIRSASAKAYLKNKGFMNVHNGGSWQSLKQYSK